MIRTAEGAQLADLHRQVQSQIRARALQDYMRIWPLWRGDERTFNDLVAAAVPLVNHHHQTSATLAAAFFESFRRVEKASGDAPAHIAGPPPQEQVVASLYVTGSVQTRNALIAGQPAEQAMRTALVRTSGAVGRHVLNGGRTTVIESAATDRQAIGWERVTSGRPCAFCAMMASRGPVYSSTSVDFQSHDHCLCTAVPSYQGGRSPQSQRWADLYNRAQREGDAAGTANDPLNNFRRLIESAG